MFPKGFQTWEELEHHMIHGYATIFVYQAVSCLFRGRLGKCAWAILGLPGGTILALGGKMWEEYAKHFELAKLITVLLLQASHGHIN